MFDSETFGALASHKRLQILEWLKDPEAQFPPQRDGDLVKDGVCVIFIADKLGVAQPTATAHLKTLARAGLVTSKCAAISPAESSPSRTSDRIWRRCGAAIAFRAASMGSYVSTS